MTFNFEDSEKFKKWLELDWESLTWKGKFEKDFSIFWNMFFEGQNSIQVLMERYQYAIKTIKGGPLNSWFRWLRDKNLCYLFIYKDISLEDLSSQSFVSIEILANIIRTFLVDKYPQYEHSLNEKFSVSHYNKENASLKFSDLQKDFLLEKRITGSSEDDLMLSLEVTLYHQWNVFIKKMKRDFSGKIKIREKKHFKTWVKSQRKFFQEVLILSLLGGTSVYLIKRINEWYEESMAEKIRLFEPDFLWTDKLLAFKNTKITPHKMDLELREIEKQKDSEFSSDNFAIEERFEEESEVMVSSFESIPKGLKGVEFEKSQYEESLKGGYRDEGIGERKVYRIMIKSREADNIREKIYFLLKEYKVTQANLVRPGTKVPGGVYFNLFVPKDILSNFLAKVLQVEESSLYISKTRKEGPAGKTKVFIWIKEL